MQAVSENEHWLHLFYFWDMALFSCAVTSPLKHYCSQKCLRFGIYPYFERLLLLFCVRAKICFLWLFWRNLNTIKVNCVIQYEHVRCLFYYTYTCIVYQPDSWNYNRDYNSQIVSWSACSSQFPLLSFLNSWIAELLVSRQLKFLIPLLKELDIICIIVNDVQLLSIADS
jgi:hypothetical protein